MTTPTAAILAASCPEDAGVLVREARWALRRSLVARDEALHLPTCLASKVNSQRYACSKDCQRVQIAVAHLDCWTDRHATAAGLVAGRQMTLMEAV